MAIVRIFFVIHLLTAKGKFLHALSGSAENDVHHRTVFRFGQSLIGIFDSAESQYVRHPFRNIAARVNGTYFPAGHDFKIQVFACGVVVAFGHGIFFRPFAAVAQMLVALGGSNAF